MLNKRWIIIGIAALLLAAASIGVGVHQENNDAFCASCHTEPESTYYQRSLVAPSDLASAHAALNDEAVHCIDCHSGVGAGGRAQALAQGAWDLARYLSGTYDQPAHTTNPVGDAGCRKCHTPPGGDPLTDYAQPFASNDHFHRASYLDEWAARDPDPYGTCTFCHVAHTEGTIAEMHFTSPVATNDGCNDCHQALEGWHPGNN